jgi:hypothetical protein
MRFPGIHNIQIDVISNNLINCCKVKNLCRSSQICQRSPAGPSLHYARKAQGAQEKKKESPTRSAYFLQLRYCIIEELDLGSLHPLLEHLRQTCPGRGRGFKPPTSCTAGRHSSKGLSRKFITNLEHLHEAFTITWLPQYMCSP